MKIQPRFRPLLRSRSTPTFPLPLLAAIMSLGLGICPAHAQQYDDRLPVGVRTHLDSQKKIWDGVHSRKAEPPAHGKIYAILMIQPTKSARKLVKPVNAAAIKEELMRQLAAQGYQHVGPNQKPEILVSVIYGRSHLPNPYFTKKIDVDNMGPENEATNLDYQLVGADRAIRSAAPPGIAITDPDLAANLSIPAVSRKATKAQLEKLFILVRAYKYPPPTDPKKKPEILWVATMYVDDPDHQDLNVVAKQMLEAGAPYFDRETKDPEVEVLRPLPDGHVKVGTPKVVKSDEKK